MRVADIASGGLVYALDPSVLGKVRNKEGYFTEDVYIALGNILEAQEFDAIPLIPGHKKDVTHIARRRLHQGDEHEVYILAKNEVECISRNTSILEAIFRILSNEHHILLLENELNEVTDMLTISMIDNPKVKSYLRLKISQLQEDNWDWNSKFLTKKFNPEIEFANQIFSKIGNLAKLISENEKRKRGSVPSDREVSQLIVEILAEIQPLKPFEDNKELLSLDDEGFYLENNITVKKRNTAKEIQHEWAGSLMDKSDDETKGKKYTDEIIDFAFHLFSSANDWDSLLLRKSDGTFDMLTKSKLSNEIEQSDTITINEDTSHLEIAKILFQNNNKMIVVENEDSKWPGIITIHDFALNQNVQNDALLNFTQIEMACREKLVSEGIQVMTLEGFKRRLICVVNFNDVIKELDNLNLLSKRSKNNNKLNNIRFCRNKLVHEVIGHDMELFPSYMQYVFLEAYINSMELIRLFEVDEGSKYIMRQLIALDAFVIGSKHSIKRKTPKNIGKIIKEFLRLDIEDNSIIITVEKSAETINQALDGQTDLGTWRQIMLSYFDDIDQVMIVNAQD